MTRALAGRLFTVYVVLVACTFGQRRWNPTDNQLSSGTVAILEQADQFELLALNPVPGLALNHISARGDASFHGYKILQTAQIKDTETRKKLISALMQSMQESRGDAAICFNPRHGIRTISKGRHADLVICFECLQAKLYGDREGSFLITSSPQKLFDEVLKGHANSTTNRYGVSVSSRVDFDDAFVANALGEKHLSTVVIPYLRSST